MKYLLPMVAGLMACAIQVNAQAPAAPANPPHAQKISAAVDPVMTPHISGKDVKPVTFAEWELKNDRGTTVPILWGDALSKAPANASRYEQKTFEFPTGQIRVMEFKKDRGGVLHMITAENAMYVLKGSVTIDVGGKPVEIKEGDAVGYPSGIMRGKGDATVVVWTVTGTVLNEAAKTTVVRKKDAKIGKSAEWEEGGKRVRANTPEGLKKMPKDAIRLQVDRFEIPGNSIRLAHNYKGGPTSGGRGPIDALILVTSGHLTYFEDGKPYDAWPGDAIRESAGHENKWNRIEDSSFLAISTQPIGGPVKVAGRGE